MEPREELQQALSRELREELGIEIQQCHYWESVEHCYPDLNVRLHLFHVTAFSGQPEALLGQQLAWLDAQSATELPFLEADRPLLRKLALCKL